MSERDLVIAPPPTPNGDLHVGHMAGPYLAADVFKRYRSQHGVNTYYAVSTDDNQTYVDTTAQRIGVEVDELLKRSRSEIRETLLAYDISLDVFGEQNGAYEEFIIKFFAALLDAGLVKIARTSVLFEESSGSYPVESFVAGFCSNCFRPSCGGICEACGHPNDGIDLLDMESPGFVTMVENRLILDIEEYRKELARDLLGNPALRPKLRGLVSTLLEKPLAPFVLSYKAPRGISASFAGLEDQKVNVWGEMYPGHIFFLSSRGESVGVMDRYFQFLGFDNSYYYCIVHLALGYAARKCGMDWPLPTVFFTNQFYNYEGLKFSTSKNHLIWARELASEYDSDVIRLFLCFNSPEYQEADFSLESFRMAAEILVTRVNSVVHMYNDKRGSLPEKPNREGVSEDTVRRMFGGEMRQFDFSMRAVAERNLAALEFISHRAKHDDEEMLLALPSLLAVLMYPMCPKYALSVARVTNLPGVMWRDVVLKRSAEEIPKLAAGR